MADYKDIKGGTIQNFAGDPPAPIAGQVWYDSTAIAFQYRSVNPAGSWASGDNLNTSRYIVGGAGTQTASLVFGGVSSTVIDNTESYNGSAWTELNDLSSAKAAGADGGTPSSAMFAGGEAGPGATNDVDIWNGTSWTETSDLATNKRYIAGSINSSTAALVCGGITPGSAPGTGATELWNGSSWTEVNDLNNPRRSHCGTGTTTAGLAFGGYDGASRSYTETWNGTRWTEVNDMDSTGGWGGAFGTQTASVVSNGTTVQTWDGTNWAAGASNSTNTTNRAGNGTFSAGMISGGEPPTAGVVTTEQWVSPTETSETITD